MNDNVRTRQHTAMPVDRLRRRLLGAGAAGAVLCMALPAHARAGYPARPIRLVVPFAPGGGTDASTRVLGLTLGDVLGQPVVIENKGGGGGTIGMEQVARAEPDGYTLVMATNGPMITGKLLYPNLAFDPLTDLKPVVPWFSNDNLLCVKASSPYQSFEEWVTEAKRRPGDLTYGTAGVGSTLHITAELLQRRVGMKMQHVPYRGGSAAMIDLLAGSVDATVDSTPSVIPQVRAGNVRVLVNLNGRRSVFLPDVPTVQESGYDGFSEYSWGGLFAPVGTSDDIVAKLNQAVGRVGKRADVCEKMAGAYADILSGTPEAFAQRFREEAERWIPVVKAAGISG